MFLKQDKVNKKYTKQKTPENNIINKLALKNIKYPLQSSSQR